MSLNLTFAVLGATTARLRANVPCLPAVYFTVDWAGMDFAVFFLVDVITSFSSILGMHKDIARTRAFVFADATAVVAGGPRTPLLSDAVNWAR